MQKGQLVEDVERLNRNKADLKTQTSELAKDMDMPGRSKHAGLVKIKQ
jgi:uncharacterized protein (UPF0335 family)